MLTARIPTFVVNLPEDSDRLDALRAQLNPTAFDLRGRMGFLGRTLPDVVCLQLTHDPNSIRNKGALGVMLSHVSIWEHVAQLNEPFGLVLEDDVSLNDIDRLATAGLPPGFDIIFCGDQSSNETVLGFDDEVSCMPAIDALPLVERRGVSIGAYGYLLSPQGARRLLELFDQHFFFGHVDVRMLAYCCDLDELNAVQRPGHLTEELCAIRRLIDDKPKLAGYATMQALVIHIGMVSRREREDTMGMTQRANHAGD